MFQVESYCPKATDRDACDPSERVLAYINAFQRWSKDCYHWLKANNNDLDGLSRLGARNVLLALRECHCVSENRQYRRAAGHYWIGGAADTEPQIERVEMLSSGEAHVITAANKQRHRKAHRFVLRRVGASWKIQSLAVNAGLDRWLEVDL